MKNIFLYLAIFAGVAGLTLSAQQTTAPLAVTTDFSYTSEYIFRGVQRANSAFTPSLEVSADNAYLGLWTMQPATKHQNNEIDIYAGYKQKITGSVSAEALFTYYWYPEAEGFQTTKSYELGAGVTYANYGITASAYGYYDFRLQANTWVGSVGYSFPLEKIGASIDVDFYAGVTSAQDWKPDLPGMNVHESYNYYGCDVNIPYRIPNSHATLTAGLHYATNQNTPVGTPDNKIWFTVGLSVGF